MATQRRIALITGASSGIGAAIARELAGRGYGIALAARRVDALEAVATELRTAGGAAVSLVCDVTNHEQIRVCVEHAMREFGRLDVLVNNAGVMHNSRIADADVADWRAMIEVNLMGLMLMTHAVLPHMRAARTGHIVNISSVAGRIIIPGNGVYNVTKWGVNVFSEALRREVYADGIKVTTVSPGVVETELFEKIADPQARSEFQAYAAAIEPLAPADIARAVGYAVDEPANISVNEIVVRPALQER